jgi:hypothetical protein
MYVHVEHPKGLHLHVHVPRNIGIRNGTFRYSILDVIKQSRLISLCQQQRQQATTTNYSISKVNESKLIIRISHNLQ